MLDRGSLVEGHIWQQHERAPAAAARCIYLSHALQISLNPPSKILVRISEQKKEAEQLPALHVIGPSGLTYSSRPSDLRGMQ